MKAICTVDTLKDTIKELKAMGYVWVSGDPSAEEIRQTNPKTKYFVIDCFYNYRLKRNEMQYESESWYKKHNLI